MTPNKNAPQIRQAITKIWPSMPDEFRAWLLWKKVQKELPHLDVYQDTIMHTLRMMRVKGMINYECVNRTESKYRKT